MFYRILQFIKHLTALLLLPIVALLYLGSMADAYKTFFEPQKLKFYDVQTPLFFVLLFSSFLASLFVFLKHARKVT